MEKKYVVQFMYDGKPAEKYGDMVKKLLEQFYIKNYNKFCEVVNPYFEKWNAEYDGENDGFDDEDRINPNGQYNIYIRNKEQKIIDEQINSSMNAFAKRFVKRFYAGNECEFRMEMHDGVSMTFYLKEV